MKKQMLSLLLAVVTAGCCTCKQSEPIKLSVFAGTVERIAKTKGVSLEESAALLAAAGVTGFDTSYKDPKIPDYVKAGLKPINLYGWPKFLGPDGGEKDAGEFVATAVKYGVPQIMVIPDDFPKDCDQEAAYVRILAGLERIVAKASAAGIAVTVEDYGNTNNACSYSKYLKRFMTDIPELGFALDSGNLYYAGRGEDIVDMARFAGGRIRHVHLKDQTREDNRKYTTLGTGAVPNEAVVRLVHESGYRGWYTLENPVGDDILADVLRQANVVRSWCK
ncbi:MAG TPA: TIM barrel protein [Kiritimatiellia bacterium]|nr:TIM barrel protein [Kiritimatiellia bacterium]HRU70585.1 TIM barrel protein [Kiritimatiellia bacterium]